MRRRVAAALVLLFAIFCGVRSAHSSEVPGDFLRYHRAGRLVATGRADRLYDAKHLAGQHVYAAERVPGGDPLLELEWKYSPATAVLMAPLGALHPRTANILWGAWNGLLVGLTFVAAWALCATRQSPWWMLVPLAVVGHAANDNLNLGQLNPSAIAPATVALALLARQKDASAGVLAGVGTVVKYMPGLLAVWLVWKRRWVALAAMLVTVVGLGFGLPAAVLGPARAAALSREQMEVRAHHYTAAAATDVPGQSLKSLVYRTLGGTPYSTGRGRKRVVVDVSVASLRPAVLQGLYVGLSLALVGVVLLVCGRGPRGQRDPRGPLEAAAFLTLLPLVSPEAREPHFLYLALPVTALTYAVLEARSRGLPAWRRAAWVGGVGALLLNMSSSTLLGRTGAIWASAWCVLGWSALLVLWALLTLHRAFRPAPDPS